MGYPHRQIARFHDLVAVATTSTVPIPASPGRMSVTIQNPSAQSVWVKFQVGNGPAALAPPVATATAASLLIPAGGSVTTTDYTGPIAVITTGGATSINVLDI